MKHFLFLLPLLLATSCSAKAQIYDPRDPHSPLHLVRIVALPNVRGRIDHMALDPDSRHLFVAELGANSVDDVDLVTGKVAGRISGLHEPQGVAWLAGQKEIAVACGDGTVHFYRSADRQEVAQISLGDDADNLRVDERNGHLVVGYGSGGIAVIDPAMHRILARLALPAHPEAFELIGAKIFVNVPDAHKIVTADLDRERITSMVSTGLLFGNFPMASDATGSRIAVAYRAPGTLVVLDARSGVTLFSTPICGDADDLYFRFAQIAVVCGSGSVELIDGSAEHPAVGVTTEKGARTGLLDLPSDRMFVAAPAREGAAALWELSFR